MADIASFAEQRERLAVVPLAALPTRRAGTAPPPHRSRSWRLPLATVLGAIAIATAFETIRPQPSSVASHTDSAGDAFQGGASRSFPPRDPSWSS